MSDKVTVASGSQSRSPEPVNEKAERTNLRAQGMRTRNMIVRAATKVLLQGGGLDFTLRAVARKAKISVSNLQYYFPDRQMLLRAVMAPVIEGYLAGLDSALKGDAPAREALDALIDRQLQDVKSDDTMALLWQFLALTAVDPECARLSDELYAGLVRGFAQLVEKINPKFGPAGSIQLAVVLIAMGDGLGIQIRAARGHKYAHDLEQTFRSTVDFLLHHNPLLERDRAATKSGSK